MKIPFALLVFALVAALAVVTFIVYLRIYQAKINQKLHGNAHGAAMQPPYKLTRILSCAVITVLVIASCFTGYKTAYDNIEDGYNRQPVFAPTCFYAEVVTMRGNTFTVQGLPVNDARYRGSYTFTIYGETQLVWEKGECLLIRHNMIQC